MIFRKVRESVAEFLGVAGSSDEWQQKQGDWQRRSQALHQQGRLLSQVGQDPKGSTSRLSELHKKKLFLT